MSEATPRRRAREIALQVLFQREFVQDVDLNTSLAYFRENTMAPPEAWDYAHKILEGVTEQQKNIDALITDKSRNWKLARMAPVDLCLLRIAVYEICYLGHEVPGKVAIDEALEVAKKYAGTDSTSFLNGVLDEIYKSRNS